MGVGDDTRAPALPTAVVAALLCVTVVSCAGDDTERDGRGATGGRRRPTGAGSPARAAATPRPLTGRSLRRGGTYWGVYFAVAEYGDPEVERVAHELERRGLAPSILDISCDPGAAQALGVPTNRAAVALYFRTETAASEFARAADPEPAGYARVRTRCLD